MEQNDTVFDVAIVGGGIVGSAVFNTLVRNGAKAVLLEACDDVASMTTKANSGIIHSGYDPKPNTLMAKTNVLGNKMYENMCKRLSVGFLRCGTMLVAPKSELETIKTLYNRGIENGVSGLKILTREEILKLEPNIAEDIEYALYAKTAGIVSPYLVCTALAEEGVINGGVVKTYFRVCGIENKNNIYTLFDESRTQSVCAKYVVNCAGVFANNINALVGEKQFPINLVKGEYILLDKSQKGFISMPIFPLPDPKKGKGIVAIPTIHGNVMFGPTATDCSFFDTTTSLEGIETIKNQIVLSIKKPNFKKTIKLFAGVRVKSGTDFIIERAEKAKNFYYTVGICSPGLTSAPAIAEMILEMLKADGLETKKIKLVKRKPYGELNLLKKSDLKKLIKQNPLYGKIVCRCEKVSEGEILDALNSPLKPTSVDAIKRRLRPTMGKCQGGFCLPKIVKIIANKYREPEEKVTLKGTESEIVTGDIKNGGFYDV